MREMSSQCKSGLTIIHWPELLKFVIWSHHKSKQINWNQIQIKSHVSKSNLCVCSNQINTCDSIIT